MQNNNLYDNFVYDWWKNLDKVIFFLFISLIILGIFFSLVSTSLIASSKLGTNNYYFFLRHLVYIFIGLSLIIVFIYYGKNYLQNSHNFIHYFFCMFVTGSVYWGRGKRLKKMD